MLLAPPPCQPHLLSNPPPCVLPTRKEKGVVSGCVPCSCLPGVERGSRQAPGVVLPGHQGPPAPLPTRREGTASSRTVRPPAFLLCLLPLPPARPSRGVYAPLPSLVLETRANSLTGLEPALPLVATSDLSSIWASAGWGGCREEAAGVGQRGLLCGSRGLDHSDWIGWNGSCGLPCDCRGGREGGGGGLHAKRRSGEVGGGEGKGGGFL